jgi:hypothetical protein
LLIVFSEEGRSTGTKEHTEYASVRTPTAENLRVHGDEVEAGIHPLVECFDGAPGKRNRRRTEVALPQQLQDVCAKGLRAPDVICLVPFQHAAQLARFPLCFGQLGFLVEEMSV